MDKVRPMTKQHNDTFLCPGCSATYKVAHAMGTGRTELAVHCLVCNHPLEPMKDGQIAKYFLVRRPRQKDRFAHRGNINEASGRTPNA